MNRKCRSSARAVWPAMAVALLLSCGKKEETPALGTAPDPGTVAKQAGKTETTVSAGVQNGRFFRFAVPAGWRVQEEGQFAIVLFAPDNGALTVMTGNSGVPANYPPGQFLYDKLQQLKVTDLRIGPASMARPMAGCSTAWQFEYVYTANGERCRGVAKCNVAPTYDMSTMVVTIAASKESQWSGYASWLPEAAEQVAALNGAAFGARGVMQQNLENSINLGEQARQNREWSARTWAEVNRGRAESQDRNNAQFRENLGNVQTYTNPYDAAKVELPTTYTHYWINRQGRIVGTNNPSEDPNAGSTEQWSRMSPQRR
jgi:hypothetical protein